jgi:hypothetical protein
MPGAFAHIAAVNHLISENRLDGINISKKIKHAITTQNEFCFMGAVSPDYPYLVPNDKEAHDWADAVHLGGMGGLIASGIREIKKITDSEDKARAVSWLMGFLSHVGMDMTIHPIVENIAGIYDLNAENKRKHRVCEMHQDVYIWQRLQLGEVGESEAISCIQLCGDKDSGAVHSAVRDVWEKMLSENYPQLYQQGRPDIDKWHRWFYMLVNIAEESHKFYAWARHVAVDEGCTYPTSDEVEDCYIKKLKVPHGDPMDYSELFELALKNVITLWEGVSVALDADHEIKLSFLGEWNLDRGMDKTERHVFWS